MRAFRRREFLAGAALLAAAACAPGREEPTPTSGAAGTRAIPSEKASLDVAPSASASVAAEALTAARTVVAALACGDDETDLSDLLTGEASVEVPEQLTARAATNASLTARDGTIMHARVLDSYEQTVYADDNGVLAGSPRADGGPEGLGAGRTGGRGGHILDGHRHPRGRSVAGGGRLHRLAGRQ